jgi:hypothetical protein
MICNDDFFNKLPSSILASAYNLHRVWSKIYDQLSGVRNPGKIKYLLANVVRLNDVTQAQTRRENLQPLCQNDI